MRRSMWGVALALALMGTACGSHVQDVTVVHVDARVLTDQPGGVGKAAAGIDFTIVSYKGTGPGSTSS